MQASGLRPFTAVVLLASLAGAATGLAQTFRQRVDVVSVDVTVVGGNGAAVTDLSAADFEVEVDGSPRRILAFRRVGSAIDETTAGAPQPATTGSSERLVVFVVHQDHIRPQQGRDFFAAAGAFIDALAPSDRLAVWTIPSPRVDLERVSDREVLKKYLQDLRGTAPPSRSMIRVTPDEAVLIAFYRDRSALEEVVARECNRMQNAGPVCPEEVETEARRVYNEVSLRAANTLEHLKALVKVLGAFDGPKHVVFISTGPPQTPAEIDELKRVAGSAAAARVHIHALQVPEMQPVIAADEMGRPAPAVKQHLSAGYSLADMTGGLALTPSDPRVGFRELASRLAGAYELGIEPLPSDRDGTPHSIVVRVRGRGGVSVRARQQFVLPPATVAEPPAPERPAVPSVKAAPASPSTEDAPSVADLITGLGRYISRFEREFSSAVAEERYVQLIRPLRGTPQWPSDERALEWHERRGVFPRTGHVLDRRQLLSDVLLVQTPQGWFGYRDVAEVDGAAVRRRADRVSKLFLSRDADREDQLSRIARESARYNLGTFRRTLNIPTLTLSFLHTRQLSRYTFSGGRIELLDGREAAVLRFEETRRPTLIGTTAGEDVPISGRLWLDPISHAVLQTEIATMAGERRTTLVTRYRQEPGFSVLVPDYMWEWYDAGVHSFGGAVAFTVVECLARYGNYRRFSVATEEKRLP